MNLVFSRLPGQLMNLLVDFVSLYFYLLYLGFVDNIWVVTQVVCLVGGYLRAVMCTSPKANPHTFVSKMYKHT